MRSRKYILSILLTFTIIIKCISFTQISTYASYIPVKYSSELYAELNASDKNITASTSTSPPTLHARYAALIDGDNNRLLYGKEADVKAPNASTPAITRIAYLFLNLFFNSENFIVMSSFLIYTVLFLLRKPALVTQITLSNIINNEGSTKITTNILISAPLAINVHKELIISISE